MTVKVSCDEVCTVRATGRLTNVKMDKLDPVGPYGFCPPTKPDPDGIGCPQVTLDIGPGLGRTGAAQVRQALDEGKNVKAKVTVRATDAAGNVATAKRTITLVK